MYFDIFDKDDPKFDRKLASKYVLLIKRGGNRMKTDQSKLNLYKLMKKIVIKNVKNYSNLARNSSVTERCHLESEMYGEAFIVMMKCVDNFNVNKKNCFYFYFNKSLSRNFYRMFDKEVRKYNSHRDWKVSFKSSNDHFTREEIYSVNMVIDNLKLDSFDKKVLMSKMLYEKKDDFIVNNEGATVSKYYNSIRKIKEQLQKLMDNGDI
jgi:hypothetical protein